MKQSLPNTLRERSHDRRALPLRLPDQSLPLPIILAHKRLVSNRREIDRHVERRCLKEPLQQAPLFKSPEQ